MTHQSISKASMIAIPVVIACSLLMPGAPAQAESNHGGSALSQFGFRHCSDRTLSGDYGFVSDGVLLPAPGVSLQFRSTGVAHFDGKGNLTWVEHTVIDGVLLEPDFTASATGTYAVNPDCSGTAIVSTPNSPVPLNLGFVVGKQGSEVRSVLDSNAIVSVFTKVD